MKQNCTPKTNNQIQTLSLATCTLCPRNCGVNRIAGETGYCGQTASITAARAYLHAWEEPCISGENGSGTVFFSGCNMRCVFCQNFNIARGDVSKEISSERLSEIFLELQDKKASNVNLVTPTHFVPQIIPALKRAKAQGLTIPIVYNTSAYENVSTIKALEGLVDIYLPDCKYYSDELAIRYSNAPGYFPAAMAAIDEMVRQVGEPVFQRADNLNSEKSSCESNNITMTSVPYHPSMHSQIHEEQTETADHAQILSAYNAQNMSAEEYNDYIENADDDYAGPLMKNGVIVRHLCLPGGLSDSKAVIRELLARFGNRIYISIMNQFTPYGDLENFPELLQPVSSREYDELIEYALDLGIENGFFQGEGTDSESFIPAFDFEGL